MKKRNPKKTIFNYEDIPIGFYDKIYKRKKGIQSKWHHIHYNLVKKILGNYKKHLDVGCAGGTFINFLDKDKISMVRMYQIIKLNMQKRIIKQKNINFI